MALVQRPGKFIQMIHLIIYSRVVFRRGAKALRVINKKNRIAAIRYSREIFFLQSQILNSRYELRRLRKLSSQIDVKVTGDGVTDQAEEVLFILEPWMEQVLRKKIKILRLIKRLIMCAKLIEAQKRGRITAHPVLEEIRQGWWKAP